MAFLNKAVSDWLANTNGCGHYDEDAILYPHPLESGKARLGKRIRNINNDTEIVESKRYLSEEQMSSHMEQLQLTTPPYHTDYQNIDTTLQPTDWFNYQLMTYNEEDTPQLIEEPNRTSNNGVFIIKDPMCQDPELNQSLSTTGKWEVILEDLSDDDTPERSPSHVWIAPEVQTIMESSKKETLLPSNIIKEMNEVVNKPCMELVPYIKPSHHIRQTVWKAHLLDQIQASTADNPSEVPTSDKNILSNDILYDDIEDNDDMEL